MGGRGGKRAGLVSGAAALSPPAAPALSPAVKSPPQQLKGIEDVSSINKSVRTCHCLGPTCEQPSEEVSGEGEESGDVGEWCDEEGDNDDLGRDTYEEDAKV